MLRWISRTSAICAPTSQTGFSDDVGCWKIMLIRLPRIWRIASSGELQQVRAVEHDLAAPRSGRAGPTSRRIDRLVTLLPQPDSPTRPMISPRSTWKSMPSTARTMPSRVSNDVRRPAPRAAGRPALAGFGARRRDQLLDDRPRSSVETERGPTDAR